MAAQLPPWHGFPSGLRTYDRALSGDLRELERFLSLQRTAIAQLISDEPISTSSTIAVPTSTQVLAGAGLTGGGALAADITLNVGAGTGITVGADTVSISSSYLGANPTASVGLTAVNGSATTYMRSDAAPPLDVGIAPTWTGVHTYSAQDVHNAGISVGSSGSYVSAVVDGGSAKQHSFTTSQALTTSTAQRYSFGDNSGNQWLVQWKSNCWEFPAGGVPGASATDAIVAIAGVGTQSSGIFFAPSSLSGAGLSITGLSTGVLTGAYFKAATPASSSPSAVAAVAGIFETSQGGTTGVNVADWWGAWFRPTSTGASNSTRTWTNIGGWKVWPINVTAKSAGTATNVYGGYISNPKISSNLTVTNAYGLYVEEHTGGATINNGIYLASTGATYKALTFGGPSATQNAYISSYTDGHIDLTATVSVDINAALDVSAQNIVTDTSTGTKIGTGTTQKIAFYNTSPTAQYATTGTVTGYTGGGGTALTHSDTFTGNTGSTAYTIGDIVRALKLWGAIAA